MRNFFTRLLSGKSGTGQISTLFPIILIIFFLSGFSSLVYQVIWVKILTRSFGVTTYAVSAVLAAFMGGLALGSYLGGKMAARRSDGLRLYGWLEIGLGLYALSLQGFFDGLTPLYRVLYPWLEHTPYLLALTRFGLSFLLLAPPTTLMGATLPLLAQALVARWDDIGNKIARLYAWNTLGAVFGTVIAGFLFIGLLGLKGTTWIAVSLNLIVGLTALILSRLFLPTETTANQPSATFETTPLQQKSAGKTNRIASNRMILGVVFLSGFAALGYEVIWTRILILISDHTIYAFSTMVAIVLIGIGLGSFWIGPVMPRITDPARILFWAEVALGLSTALMLLLITNGLPLYQRDLGGITPGQLENSSLFFLTIALILMLLPSLCMGIIIPLAVQVGAGLETRIGQSVGEIYSANVLGAMLGSLTAGFILIPLIGTQRGLLALVSLNLLAAGWLAYRVRNQARLWTSGCLVASLAIVITVAPGDLYQALFAYVYPTYHILWNSDGAEATVTIGQDGQVQTIFTNGAHEADTYFISLAGHLLIGHLPGLIRPVPAKSALVVGIGGGATSGALVYHVQERLDIIELSAGMIEAARRFTPYNEAVLENPKVHLKVEDGRNYLLLTDTHYDLITADTIHPWRAYSSSLYSAEYFQLLKTHLNQGGLVLQWVDSGLPDREQGLIMRTFVNVFPHAILWEYRYFKLLLGSNEPIRPDLAVITKNFDPQVAEALAPLEITNSQTIFNSFGLADDALRQEIGPGLILSDDHPYNEYFKLLRIEKVWEWLNSQSH